MQNHTNFNGLSIELHHSLALTSFS